MGKNIMLLCGVLTYRDHLNTFRRQFLSCRLFNIASDAANLELLGENGIIEDETDDRAALIASGAPDGQDLGHGECTGRICGEWRAAASI